MAKPRARMLDNKMHGFDADWGGRKSVSADCYRTIENNEQNLQWESVT